ncbi:CPBP family intramembrane metalloprotease [candidate division KSB1 bacterium]|nr:CPBP family intramembrane metalloprotease [candidate division KSB1 bacterium]
MNSGLNRKDYRLIVICLFISVFSVFFIAKYFYKAFPEASIDFKVTKSQSKVEAEKYLQKLNIDTKGYRHSAIFSYYQDAKTFLEKELGAEKANQIMGSRVKLWRWSNRWYKPLKKEEVTVRISPAGEFTGLEHKIPEEAGGASLSSDSAKVIALDFLVSTIGIHPDTLEFVETSMQQRPNRTDYTFIWKNKNWNILDAHYRYNVVIQGNRIGEYKEYLYLPDKWSRDYEKLRAKNETTGYGAAFFLFLTLIAMLFILILHTRHGNIKWKTAAIFGSVAAILTFLSQLNSFPLNQYYYTTTESYNSFMFKEILLALVYGLLAGIAIFFITAAAEPLYREKFTDKLSLSKLITWKGLRSKKFFIAVIVGLTMTFGFAGYQVIFYLVSQKLGGWSPQDIPYSNMLNTAFPWIFVLLTGFMPAVSEEFISRLFSIPFLEKYLKIRWLAVIVPAFIWGFGHANYAQQPFYIRGIEVGMAGVIIGILMIRFGIIAPLVWHYSIDAFYTALILFRSGNSYFIITAAISCGLLLLPFFIALFAFIKTRKFLPDSELSNAAEGFSRIETSPEPPDVLPEYKKLSRRRIGTGLIISILLLSFYLVKTGHIGSLIKYPNSPQKARAAADTFLQNRGVDPGTFKTVTYVTDKFDPQVAKYIVENADLDRLYKWYTAEQKVNRWAVRYFKPLQKEEYLVHIDPESLNMLAFLRIVNDDSSGAELFADSARILATNFAQSQGINVSELELREASSEKKKNRLDYTFVWESGENDSLSVAGMKFRATVELQGDVISKFTTTPKLPEKWQRERTKSTLLNSIHLALRLFVLLLFTIFAILRFIRMAKVGTIMWKVSLKIAAIVAVLYMIDGFTHTNLALRHYMTSIELNLFTITTLIGILVSSLGMFIGLGICLSMISAIYPGSLQIFKPVHKTGYARDALFTGIIAVVSGLGISQLFFILTEKFPGSVLMTGIPLPLFIDAPVPLYSNFVYMVYLSLFITLITGIMIFILKDTLQKPVWIIIFVIFVIAALVPLNVRSFGEAAFAAVKYSVYLLWIILIIKYIARNNYLAYIYTFILLTGLNNVYLLIKQDNNLLNIQGSVLLMLLLLSSIWLLLPVKQNSKK